MTSLWRLSDMSNDALVLRVRRLEAENSKLRESYKCSCVESDTLLLDVKAWQSRYKRLRDACWSDINAIGMSQDGTVRAVIDELEAEG